MARQYFQPFFFKFYFLFLFALPCYSAPVVISGQTVSISTHFNSIVDKPTWLLIVRDVESGLVIPYLYDIRREKNFWIAFTGGRTYRVTASYLKFGPYATIPNFCHLENGIIHGKSLMVSIVGNLTPDPKTYRCRVFQYPEIISNFAIVRP